ncbi:MAG TPA: hypothetical protein VGW34_05485 [Allosphingosinicella sp.]|nr:hypothetical protein [Allosphingosinicella sp.]
MRMVIPGALPLLLLSGCVSTALEVVTLPVKAASAAVGAAGKAVDVATTSQAEADQKRGRALRLREECIGQEERRARRENRQPAYRRCGG